MLREENQSIILYPVKLSLKGDCGIKMSPNILLQHGKKLKLKFKLYLQCATLRKVAQGSNASFLARDEGFNCGCFVIRVLEDRHTHAVSHA